MSYDDDYYDDDDYGYEPPVPCDICGEPDYCDAAIHAIYDAKIKKLNDQLALHKCCDCGTALELAYDWFGRDGEMLNNGWHRCAECTTFGDFFYTDDLLLVAVYDRIFHSSDGHYVSEPGATFSNEDIPF